MVTAEGVFPKTGNDPIYASEINSMHGKVQEVYTGSGFNNAAYELNAVSDVNGSDYATVRITWTGTSSTGGGSSGNSVTIYPEIKEVGGSYGDITSAKTLFQISSGPTGNTINSGGTVEFIATITAGMKTNGFQIRLTGAFIVNVQTVVTIA